MILIELMSEQDHSAPLPPARHREIQVLLLARILKRMTWYFGNTDLGGGGEMFGEEEAESGVIQKRAELGE